MGKGPIDWEQSTWILAIGMAVVGGFVNWLEHFKQSDPVNFSLIELFVDVVTAAFTGLAAFMVLESLGQPIGICAASAGFIGHMATRFLFLLERAITRKLRKLD